MKLSRLVLVLLLLSSSISLVFCQGSNSTGVISGTITDLDTQQPIVGVEVVADPFYTETLGDGSYQLEVEPGQYDLLFTRIGYNDVTIENLILTVGDTVIADTVMWEANYPPSFADATVGTSGMSCNVDWIAPYGAYEMILDDGTAEDLFVYAQAGSRHAVKFTPPSYPVTVFGAKAFVGDGSFPGNFIGTDVVFAVYDDDGTNGLPGTLIDADTIEIDGYGWVECNGLEATVDEGDFFLAMIQVENVPNAAPVGVDTDLPVQYRSYSKFQSGPWSLSALQDFMIRARVNGFTGFTELEGEPQAELKYTPRVPRYWRDYALTRSDNLPSFLPAKERNELSSKGVPGTGQREITGYRIMRYSGFNPDSLPSTGVATMLATTTGYSYEDDLFQYLPMGWYAYGVSALYSSGLESDTLGTNTVGRLMDCDVVIVATTNNSLAPVNIEIDLSGDDYPYENYETLTDSSGIHEFEEIWKGSYDLTLYKTGYDTTYLFDILITDDTLIEVELQQKKYPVYDLGVDTMTLWATWSEPLVTAVHEDFEQEVFPPPGWQSRTKGMGWYRTSQASWGGTPIPPWDSYYAVAIDDGKKRHAGSFNNGCCDYLITPPLDLRERENYVLYFDSYFTGAWGSDAYVEFTYDNGQSWDYLSQLTPNTQWVSKEIDLSGLSGPEANSIIWIAFHADDNGGWGSGWAVDNIRIQSPEPAAEYLDFTVHLDDIVQGTTPDTYWNYAPLIYGDTFTAGVTARYLNGFSEIDTFRFVSRYLPPPSDLETQSNDNYILINWLPPDPDSLSFNVWARETPDNLLGYNLYKDDSLLSYMDHDSTILYQEYLDDDLLPGHYSYSVEAVYDLAPYGFPGDTNVSARIGPIEETVNYCSNLEFIEGWNSGGFELNNWEVVGSNWVIEGNNGYPAPSVKFNWNPVASDYKQYLVSPAICAFDLVPGKIWLTYDLMLDQVNSTGQEKINVQIWEWEGQLWQTLAAYKNDQGGFNWISDTIDISNMVWNGIFRIRFEASGENSLDILNWSIDNINLYRTCEEPINLEVEPMPNYQDMKVTWDPPLGSALDEWIHWDDGINATSVGTGSQIEFEAAARWEPFQLTNYAGASIFEVSFFPMFGDATYHIRIWTGGNLFGPANLIADQPVTSFAAGDWNIIELDSPVVLDVSKNLWVGYYVNAPGGFPAGCDDGPAVDGYGNMMNFGGWQTLLQINPDLDYNWNIQAHLILEQGERSTLSSLTPEHHKAIGEIRENPEPLAKGSVFNPPAPYRSVLGYNIYRLTGYGSFYWHDHLEGDSVTEYIDKNLEPGVNYCYRVTALYEDGIGPCESALSNHGCAFVTVGLDNQASSGCNIYPNPARGYVKIESNDKIDLLKLYNSKGTLLTLNDKVDQKHYKLDISGHPTGLYFIEIRSGGNTYTGKIAVVR